MVSLVDIKYEPRATQILFELLSVREHKISHLEMPTFEEHVSFVRHNPYLAWYLIEKKGSFIGSCYVTDMNVIGLNADFDSFIELQETLVLLTELHSPLDEIKSKRRRAFTVNVAPENNKLRTMLDAVGLIPVQITYEIKPNAT